MAHTLSFAEQIMYSTVRIECTLSGGKTSTGTGFFFSFPAKDGMVIPIIVTNKHVINGSIKGKFYLTKANKDGSPLNGKHLSFEIAEFEKGWIMHPDSEVNLAVLQLGNILNLLKDDYKEDFFRIEFNPKHIPSGEVLDDFTGIEDIIMVGYPNGIWDKVNNMPIVRKGITATHPNFNYNGKKEFLIDAAAFPGSSGSPVFIFNQGTFVNKKGGTMVGSRIHLIGILYAVFQHTATGELIATNIPTSQQIVARTRVPNNLGIVIKAERILEFEPLLKKQK